MYDKGLSDSGTASRVGQPRVGIRVARFTVLVLALLAAASVWSTWSASGAMSAFASPPASPLVDRGLAFGPWRLPDSLFREPFTGTVLALHPYDAVPRLEAARKAHYRVFIILDRSRKYHQNADKSFALHLWKQEIARFAGVDFGSFVADGTVLGHLLIDEPNDPTNWNGQPIPFSTIDSAAEYSKQLWPTLPAGVAGPTSFLVRAPAWRYLDFGFAQYRPKKGEINSWLAREVAAAKERRLGLVLSINALAGSASNGPLPADELRRIGIVLAAEPYACALTMWKYDVKDPQYYLRPDVIEASRAIANVAGSRPDAPCRRQ